MQEQGGEVSGVGIVVLTAPVIIAAFINGWYLPALADLGLHWFWLVDMLQWIFLPLGLMYALARRGVRPVHYGFALPPQSGVLLAASTVLVVLTLALVYFGVRPWALQQFGAVPVTFQFEEVELTGFAGRVLWLYAGFTAGFVESIFYIGLPWLACLRWHQAGVVRISPVLFSLLSTLVFASVHWEQGWAGVVAAFAFGLAACFWFFRLRNLWQIAVAHTVIDLFTFF